MRKLLYVILFLSIFLLVVGCSVSEESGQNSSKDGTEGVEEVKKQGPDESSQEIKAERNLFKARIITTFSTGIDKPEPVISEEDYKKYNDLLEYLFKYPNKSEDALFEELEDVYGESAGELKNFMNANMQNAINYDQGKTSGDVSLEESDVKDSVEKFFTENIENPSLFNIDLDQSDIDITGLRSIATGSFSYDSTAYDYVLKIEYTGDFQEVGVFQLKVDNINIDVD